MSRKITLQSNGSVQAVLLDGKQLVCDDSINMGEFLPRLCRGLGIEYESQYGNWNSNNEFKQSKPKK